MSLSIETCFVPLRRGPNRVAAVAVDIVGVVDWNGSRGEEEEEGRMTGVGLGLRLDVVEGPSKGTSLALGQAEACKGGGGWKRTVIKVGRTATGSQFRLKDAEVSQRHGELRVNSDGEWEVVDLGSSNGTHVNGVEVAEGVGVVLRDGDEVMFGTTSLVRVTAVREEEMTVEEYLNSECERQVGQIMGRAEELQARMKTEAARLIDDVRQHADTLVQRNGVVA